MQPSMGPHAFSGIAFALALLGGCSAQSGGEADTGETQATVSVERIDCGALEIEDLSTFSIAGDYKGVHKTLTDSCYLIRHGDDLMLWDTGLPGSLIGNPQDGASLKTTIVEQLRAAGIDPANIDLVGISHYHFDHIGQLPDFPKATLLTGADDWKAVKELGADERVQAYAPWTTGGGKVRAIDGDTDVFGDGSVVILDLPGHTPGHSGLKLRTADGVVLLSGDVAHFGENYETAGVPTWNTDPQASVQSIERFKQIAADNNATVVIGHEPADIGKIPALKKQDTNKESAQ